MENIDLNELYKKLESEELDAEYDSDIFKWYSNSIRMPLLTEEENRILLYQISLGDKRARQIFIKRNMRLAKVVALKYINCGLSVMDLIGEGNISLIKAVDNYDLSFDTSFSTYAYVFIDRAIRRAVNEKGRLISIPVNKNTSLFKFNRAYEELLFKNNREPSDFELASALDISIDQLLGIKNLNNKAFLISDLYNKEDLEDAERELIDINDNQSFEESLIDKLSASSILNDIIDKANLTENELRIIRLLYGFTDMGECKQKDIAPIVNLSKQRISQIKLRSLKKLNRAAVKLSYLSNSKKI